MDIQDNLFKNLMSRFSGQSSSNYVQIEYIREIGFLCLSGIKMPIISKLLNLEFIDPSKYAISVIYPAYVSGEIMGAAGGMSLTNLYFIMGWFSVPCFFLFVFMFGFIDRIVLNSIYNKFNGNAFYINISFYAMITCNFAVAIGSFIWIVFSIPIILSPSMVIVISVYFIFIKIPCRVYRALPIHSAYLDRTR
jgi:hypothetical protein